MPKMTQSYVLWQMLTGSKDASGAYLPVTVDAIVDHLKIARSSVPVYIFQLRDKYKAEIENITETSVKKKGARKVVAYRLVKDVKVDPYRANAAITTADSVSKPKKSLRSTILETGELPTLEDNHTYDDREMLDIRASLSLEDFD